MWFLISKHLDFAFMRPSGRKFAHLIPCLPPLRWIAWMCCYRYLQECLICHCKHDWKLADVHPRLTKPQAELIFSNLHPISNLSFVSKLVEQTVFSQTHNHLTAHALYPKAQSSYRRFHSTETALLCVQNDILLNMNQKHATRLVLLDLSAAFDTVDHSILLNHLYTDFGISEHTYSWFKTYLHNWSFSVSINGATSNKFGTKYGVPQGSCLGPLLFILYTSKLFQIIERHLPNVHAYADNTQLYISFNANFDDDRPLFRPWKAALRT